MLKTMNIFLNFIKNFIKINIKFLNALTETNVGILTYFCLVYYVISGASNKVKADYTFFYYVCLIFIIYSFIFSFSMSNKNHKKFYR